MYKMYYIIYIKLIRNKINIYIILQNKIEYNL